ncbi:MAG: thymidine phosphorylase [Anaerolineaceae bacterium]
MRAVDIIIKKRDGRELSLEEIKFFIKGMLDGDIPDYQVSAWLMAIQLNGMSDRETTDLTLSMANSGDILDLSKVVPIAVDKHSTGGVGDKTTLVVEPLVAACGLPVGKMSGRGLGFSGGTLDKIESIPGFRTDLSKSEFIDHLREYGLVLTGQTGDLAPADGRLYALRDVTGTVQSIPLIASSIMSKKIAAGAQAIVLDVKMGFGAFMKNLDEARELSELMVSIGKLSGRKVIAVISDMNQPLGEAVGNALELREAIDTLHDGGPADFREHCLVLAGHLLVLGNKAENPEKARKMAEEALKNGSAWEKFRRLVSAQGGDVTYIDQPEKLPKANHIETVNSPVAGFLAGIDAGTVGKVSVELGGGRAKKSDKVDFAVGIMIHHKVGEQIKQREALFTVHANDRAKLEKAKIDLLNAHSWSDKPVLDLPLFYDVIE